MKKKQQVKKEIKEEAQEMQNTLCSYCKVYPATIWSNNGLGFCSLACQTNYSEINKTND